MNAVFSKLKGDKVIWMVAILLSMLSILAVYSSISTLVYAKGSFLKPLVKHLMMLGLGFGVMYIVHRMRFKYFSRLSQVMIWVSAIMLLLTLIFGAEINEARRWLQIPFIKITFQTSDLAKVVLVVYVARMLNQKRTMLHNFKEGVLPILYPIIIICALILPADFSTAALLATVCGVLMFIGGVPMRHMLKIVGMAVGGIGLIYLLGKAAPDTLPRFDTWAVRIDSFFTDNPGESSTSYQIERAQYAIYDGGLAPHGPGTGTSRNFLPQSYSDMIFAFIIQEYGSILGGLGLILLFLILLYRSIKLSVKSPSHFGGLLAIGLGFMIVFQAMINMAVAVNILPTTGQTLPLVSWGGTSMLFICLSLGIILSVSREVYNPELAKSGHSGSNKVKSSDDKDAS
jgi:cell division protein FtsW